MLQEHLKKIYKIVVKAKVPTLLSMSIGQGRVKVCKMKTRTPLVSLRYGEDT